MKSQILMTGLFAGMLLLGGCAGQELYSAQRVQPTGSEFNQSLYRGYIGLAESEYSEGDYRDSDEFAVRAKQVAGDASLQPEMIEARSLPSANVEELTEARASLVAALDSGASEAKPAQAAEAQVYFDCWMQEQEENWQSEDIARCRDGFYASLDGIQPPPMVSKAKPQAVRFVVYFDNDKFNLDDEDSAVLAEAKAAAEKLGTPIVRISGNTDTTGSAEYNQALSELRAQAVAKVLEGDTPLRAMTTEANGELMPAVQTADEISEPRNRRVEIILEP